MEFITIYEDDNCQVEVSDVNKREITFVRDDCFFTLTLGELLTIIQLADDIWK